MIKFKTESIILVIATILIFLNLTIYLPAIHLFPFPAYTFDLMLFFLLIYIYIKKNIAFPLSNVLLIWVLYYTLINIIYFITSNAGPLEYNFYKNIIFFIFFVVSMILLFNLDDENLTTTRKTLIGIAIIASISLGIEFINPGYYVKNFANIPYMAGRASSFYLNANIAGGAIVLFLILTIDIVKEKYRILYILILFMGVLFTLSRSNLLIYFIMVFLIIFQRKVNKIYAILVPLVIVLFIGWLGTGGLNTLSKTFDFEVTDNIKNRINFFADSRKSSTRNLDERKMVLEAALNMFADHPILGNGFAATRLWKYRVSPHNTFAMQWAEFGIFGVLIIPLILFFSTYYIFKYGKKEDKQMAVMFIIYFIFACMFSHNIFEQPYRIAAVAMLATLGYKAKQKHILKYKENLKR